MNDMTPIGKTEMKKQWALDLVSRGVALILLHHTNPGGTCTCGRPSKPVDPATRVKGMEYCGSQGKHPLATAWQENTTTDPAIIAGWFEHNPESNYGCVAGETHFILDIDVKDDDGYETAKELLGVDRAGLDSMTFSVKTPSGGEHLYFAADKAYSNSVKTVLGKGLDSRSGNGFVVGPGCGLYLPEEFEPDNFTKQSYAVVTAAPFTPLPDTIRTRVREAIKAADGKDVFISANPATIDSPENIYLAREYLKNRKPAVIGQGGDEHTKSTSQGVRDFNITEDLCYDLMMELYNVKCSPPWEPDELRRKVRNGYAYAKKQWGCRSAASADTFDAVSFADVKDTPKDTPAKSRSPEPDSEKSLRDATGSMDINALMKRNRRYSYLVPSIIPDHGTVFIAGSYGMFKTTLMEDLLFALAVDKKWMGSIDVQPGFVVLHHQMEDDIGTEVRANAWSRRYDAAFPAGRLQIVKQPLDLTDIDGVKAYIKKWKARYPAGTRFVNSFDTWRRLLSGIGQLEDKLIQPMLNRLDYLSDQMHGPNIIAAHPPKAGKEGDEKTMSVSGLMNIAGSATGMLYLTPSTAGGKTVQVWVEKSRGADARYVIGHAVPSLYGTGRRSFGDQHEQTMLLSFYEATPLAPAAQKAIDAGQEKARLLMAADIAWFFAKQDDERLRQRAPISILAKHLTSNRGNV